MLARIVINGLNGLEGMTIGDPVTGFIISVSDLVPSGHAGVAIQKEEGFKRGVERGKGLSRGHVWPHASFHGEGRGGEFIAAGEEVCLFGNIKAGHGSRVRVMGEQRRCGLRVTGCGFETMPSAGYVQSGMARD